MLPAKSINIAYKYKKKYLQISQQTRTLTEKLHVVLLEKKWDNFSCGLYNLLTTMFIELE